MNAALVLLLLVALAPADVPTASIDALIVSTHDLAGLTEADAGRLVGKRARFRLVLDSSEWEHDGYVSYDCVSNDGTHKTVSLIAGEEASNEMQVEARLVIRHHRAWTAQNGAHFPAFTEYRLMDARRCR